MPSNPFNPDGQLRAYCVTFHSHVRGYENDRHIVGMTYAAKSKERAEYLAAKALVTSGLSYSLGEAFRRISFIEHLPQKDLVAAKMEKEGSLNA